MPQLLIETNLRLSQIPADFNEKTTMLMAELQNKPSSLTLVSIKSNQMITFGGTNEPCALVTVQSIGQISPDENRQSSKRLMEHIQNELNISPERMFVNYFNMEPWNVAWNCRIYEDIFADKMDVEIENKQENEQEPEPEPKLEQKLNEETTEEREQQSEEPEPNKTEE